MDKGSKNLQMEIFIKEIMQMVNHLVMVNIIGRMEVILKETLRMD